MTMSRFERQLREDRVLRNAAKALFRADFDRIRTEMKARPLGRRAAARVKDGAAELLDSAQEKAGDNVGIVALLLGAIGLWFARNPILEALGLAANEDAEGDPQPPNGDET
jgi:hypothetical protein